MAAAKKRTRKQAAQVAPRVPALPRLAALKIGEWESVLGGDVSVDIAPHKTLLVGRNGAGKSAILDAIVDSASIALGNARLPDPRMAGRFRCDVEIDGVGIGYEHRWTAGEPKQSSVTWNERCWTLADERDLWRVDNQRGHVA